MYINCAGEEDEYGCGDVCKICGFDCGVQDAIPSGRDGLLISK